nr:hypothetical protein [uncultured bacterium]
MRRALIAFVFVVPALALIGWLIATQLPRWTAPQANWFASAPNTPGVCAAVESLVLYGATRADVGGIGEDAALDDAMLAVVGHYKVDSLNVLVRGMPVLGVQATLPGGQQRGEYYVVVVPLQNDALPKAAVIYIDAQTAEAQAVITAIVDPAANCDFDVKAALLAAVKTPPLIGLVAYSVIVLGGLIGWWGYNRFLKKGHRR